MTNDTRRFRIAPALCVFIMVGASVFALSPSEAQTQGVDPVPLEWWGETDIGEGFHLRIPVTVTNHRDHDVENGAVFAELDITHKLIEAGWVSQARSGDDLLRLFNLDEASIRVVAMTDLEPMTSNSIHGRLGLYTKQFEPGDLRRHEVPSTHFEGFLSDPDAPDFKATTNPIITVLWRVPGVMEPDDERHFMVYFDSTTNAKPADDVHDPAQYRGVEGFDMLERSFWSGPGMDLVGFVTPGTSEPGLATVIGLHDATEVTVLLGKKDLSFSKQGSVPSHSNPFSIDAGEIRDIFISNTYGTPFRLVADRPIMALVSGEGFVPSTTGGITASAGSAGDSFLFTTTHAASRDQDSLYFYNLHPDPGSNPATIELVNLDNGNRQTINLNDAGNHFPYTIGAHYNVDPSSNQCSHADASDPQVAFIPSGRADYRAEVVSGGPVALQYGPASGVTQIPATDGRPAGTHFWTATSKTTCSGVTQQNNFYVVTGESAEFTVSNKYETPPPGQLFPSCSGGCTGQGVGPLRDGAFLRSTFTGLDGIPDRPAEIRSDSDAWILMGPAPTPTSLDTVPLRGPLGGSDVARVFNGVGSTVDGRSEPAFIYSPFGDTRVLADIQYAASAPAIDLPLNLLQGRMSTLPSRPSDPILSYHLESDRPIIVLPRGAAPGFLAGMPVTLQPTIHGADYRGHLVDIQSTTGLNPVSGSTLAGEPVTYSFVVTNLGRNAGATDLADTISMKATGVPPGWSVTIEPEKFRLRSYDETQIVRMTVTPPDGAETQSLTPIHLHALSQNGIGQSVETDTFIKSDYGVGIWFDGVRGGKQDDQSAPRGTPINYTIFVQNLGSVPDTIQLDVSPKDWGAKLLRDGVVVDHVDLAKKPKDPLEGHGGSVAELKLQVTPPVGGADGFLLTTVTARSLNSPAEEDKVFAKSRVQAPSDLSLVMDDRTVWVRPDGTAQFNFTLHNDGEGGAEAFFAIRSDLLPGWTEPQISFRSPNTGQLTPLTTDPPKVSIGEDGDVVPLAVTLGSPTDAKAGDQVTLRLEVSAKGETGTLEAFLRTIVEPVHSLEVIKPSGTLRIRTGGVVAPVELRVNNTGNLQEILQPKVASLPPGWNLTVPADEIVLPRGVTQTFDIGIRAPFGVAEGEYEVILALVSRDGARVEVAIPVEVGTFASIGSIIPDGIIGQPGRTVWTDHTVRNDGNTLLQASVEAATGELWTLASSGGPFIIPPGANVTIPVGWEVPISAADGVSSHSAQVVLQPDSAGATTLHETVDVSVDIGRADLKVVDASMFDGPAGKIVQATVANHGDRAAYGAVVQLRADSEPVDDVAFGVIAPGEERPVTLLRPDGYDGDSILVLDPENVVVESSESNNVLNVDTLELDGSTVSTPSPGFAVGLALVLLAAAMRRPPRGPARSVPGHAMAGTTPQNGPAMAGNPLKNHQNQTIRMVGGVALHIHRKEASFP